MLLDGPLHDDDFRDIPEEEYVSDDEYASRKVPGIYGLLAGSVKPKPYPINIYNIDDQSHSGIAGTLYPDGTFVLLDGSRSVGARLNAGHGLPSTLYWDDRCACRRLGKVVWDGVVAGSIEHGDFGEPHQRLWDGSITGEWPNHPPRAGRVVNPEKAREAALEAERDRREWQ